MKAFAVILMILLVLVLAVSGMLYFFGFVMSFDAPGSASDGKAWGTRFLFFLPVIFCGLMLVLSIIAFARKKYGRSALYSGSIVVLAVGLWIAAIAASFASVGNYQAQLKAEKELAKKYPAQKYLRPTSTGGTDTLIVWPTRMVAYRLYIPENKPWGGQLGDLNEARDTLIYYESRDNRIRREELDQFVDEGGRKFTDVYGVR